MFYGSLRINSCYNITDGNVEELTPKKRMKTGKETMIVDIP